LHSAVRWPGILDDELTRTAVDEFEAAAARRPV
jgi:hypothetical protein